MAKMFGSRKLKFKLGTSKGKTASSGGKLFAGKRKFRGSSGRKSKKFW